MNNAETAIGDGLEEWTTVVMTVGWIPTIRCHHGKRLLSPLVHVIEDGVIAASAVSGFLLICLIAIGVVLLVKRRNKRLKRRKELRLKYGHGHGGRGTMEFERTDPTRRDSRMGHYRSLPTSGEEEQHVYIYMWVGFRACR